MEGVMPRSVVLGADSSTQSTKAIAVDMESGEIVGEGRAPATTDIAVDRAEGLSFRDAFDWSVAAGG